jgi:hypothetical protein
MLGASLTVPPAEQPRINASGRVIQHGDLELHPVDTELLKKSSLVLSLATCSWKYLATARQEVETPSRPWSEPRA